MPRIYPNPRAVFSSRYVHSDQAGPSRGDRLSRREHEVMIRLCDGLTYKEVAKALGVSRKTIEKHVLAIYVKWGVHSQVAALRHAIQHGHYSLPVLEDAAS